MKITETEKDQSAAEYSPEYAERELSAVEITDISTAGEGIGRIGGAVVFIPHTVPGDTAEVEITEIFSEAGWSGCCRLLRTEPMLLVRISAAAAAARCRI